jgi:hypothetical protein
MNKKGCRVETDNQGRNNPRLRTLAITIETLRLAEKRRKRQLSTEGTKTGLFLLAAFVAREAVVVTNVRNLLER